MHVFTVNLLVHTTAEVINGSTLRIANSPLHTKS
jgi:hypothetical protein